MGGCCVVDSAEKVVLNTELASKEMLNKVESVGNKYPDVKLAYTQDLWKEIQDQKEVVILDTRSKEEYDISHVAGAISVSPGMVTADVLEIVQNKRNIDLRSFDGNTYCYCTIGGRSSKMAKKLTDDGITNVYNVQGAILQWVNDGRPLVNNAGKEVQIVHTYNIQMAKFVRGGIQKVY